MRLRLERRVELVLTAGILLSTSLLLFGLALRSEAALRAGVVLLMTTPLARILVVTLDLLRQRDWPFTLVSAFVLGVLATGIVLSFR